MKLKIRLIGTIVLLVLVSIFTTIEITSYIVNIQINEEFTGCIESTAKVTYDYLDERIKGDWSVQDGELYKGDICLNYSSDFVDNIYEKTGYYITLFAQDTRVTTNIKVDGTRAIGSTASQEVVDAVLNRGETYKGMLNVVGYDLECIYMPIKDVNGTPVGMFFIGTPRITMNQSELNGTMVQIVVLCVILMVLLVSAVLYLNGIIKAMASNVRQINRMSERDFTSKIHKRLIKRKDEFGTVFKATANMQNTIGQTVKDIRTSTDKVNIAVASTTNNLNDLDQAIEKIAAVTQEMAASFEETAASTEEINASVIEMKQAVDDVTAQVKMSEQQAQESEQKSLHVKEEAKKSIEETLEMIEHNRVLVTKAIEQSRSIEQISKLSDTILDIASETNLLSLNASIEAARAGESGRSFTIVANQIKSLSESSQKAVTEIQNVVHIVIESVTNLATTSKELMNFIDHKVSGDYKILEATGNEYYDSTLYFANVLKEISCTSEQLLSRVNNISAAVNEVTNATNENSAGITQIADNITSIDSKADDVLELMKETSDVSSRLEEIAASFKIKTE